MEYTVLREKKNQYWQSTSVVPAAAAHIDGLRVKVLLQQHPLYFSLYSVLAPSPVVKQFPRESADVGVVFAQSGWDSRGRKHGHNVWQKTCRVLYYSVESMWEGTCIT